MNKNLKLFSIDITSDQPLPFADEGIRAGFPSPAQDYMEQAINLDKKIGKHSTSTFYGRMVGNSMCDKGKEISLRYSIDVEEILKINCK